MRPESATTAFTFETVDGPGTVIGQACLALDKNGNPHIAYTNVGTKLMLASRVDGAWIHEELSGAGQAGGLGGPRVRLEIDSEGNPHIAYYEYNTSNLYYAVKRDNQWEFTPIPTSRFGDPRGVGGFDFRLHRGRLSPELRDTPYFVFQDLTTNSLGFTRKVAGQFKRILVVAENYPWSIGENPSMAFDPLTETLLISYTENLDTGGPEPLTRVRMTRILDPSKGTVGYTALLEEGRFRVVKPTSITTSGDTWCVAYADLTNGKLKASYFDVSLAEPHKEIVSTTVFPVVPSVVFAPRIRSGYRIAFGDENKLKLASRNQLGEWNVEVVDPEGGGEPSLAYDNLGNAHIAYTVGGTLKYAKGTPIGDRWYPRCYYRWY